jgi:hypothetical protein
MLIGLISVLIIVVVGAICFWAIDKFVRDERLANLLTFKCAGSTVASQTWQCFCKLRRASQKVLRGRHAKLESIAARHACGNCSVALGFAFSVETSKSPIFTRAFRIW